MTSSPAGRALVRLLSLALASCTLLATSPVDAPERATRDTARRTTATSLPLILEHRYRMAAKIRPLLFWIGKDDVGGGRITWRRGGDGAVGYEFLIGSDPERAPRRINRWGYIAEEVDGHDARLLGVMKQSDEASIDEAKAKLAREGADDATFAFKAIRGTVTSGEAVAGVSTLLFERDLTFRDLDALLEALAESGRAERKKRTVLPSGVRTGFLTSVAELVTRTVDAVREHQDPGSARSRPVPYLYNGTLYELRLRSAKLRHEFELGATQYANVVESRFETRNQTTGETSRFELAYGTEGELAAIPVRIVYQPRWWFAAELVLDESVDF